MDAAECRMLFFLTKNNFPPGCSGRCLFNTLVETLNEKLYHPVANDSMYSKPIKRNQAQCII